MHTLHIHNKAVEHLGCRYLQVRAIGIGGQALRAGESTSQLLHLLSISPELSRVLAQSIHVGGENFIALILLQVLKDLVIHANEAQSVNL